METSSRLAASLATPFSSAAAPAGSTAAGNELKVMSFNVRTMTGNDGVNGWEHRRDLFADTIRQLHPDVNGTQKLHRQGDETHRLDSLPGRQSHFGRDDYGVEGRTLSR